MANVIFVNENDERNEVEIEDGESIMSLAVNNLVTGIDGECGGAMACATCHCYLDDEYAQHFAPVGEMEDAMLEMVPERKGNSRLSCQLELSAETPDIVVHIPAAQH